MTQEPEPSSAEPAKEPVEEASRTRRVGWWIAGAAAAVVVIVIVVVAVNSGSTLTADERLEQALLTEDDFPSGYDVSLLSQDELDQAADNQGLPDDVEISPQKCADLLEAQPTPEGDYSVGAVQARQSTTAYVEIVSEVEAMPEWNTAEIDRLLDACGEASFSQGGQSATMTFDKLTAPRGADDSYALSYSVSAGGVEITLAIAVSRVGEYVVVFTGGGQGSALDDAEFLDLAEAANAKVARTF